MNESNLSKILGGLKYVPASIGIKVLEKAHPMFKNYFSKVTAYGLDASKALDYLTSRFSNPNDFEQSLQSRNPDQLRSDERIAKNEISASKGPGKALRNAASLATGLTLGTSTSENQPTQTQSENPSGSAFGPQTQAQEIAPRVSQVAENVREAPSYQKINPMNAANVAAQAGQNVKTGMAKQALQGATGAANLIAQFPELGRYLDDLIKNGSAPEQAALQAKSVKKFMPQIQAIEQKVGDAFENIIAQLFGKPSQQKPSETPQKSSSGLPEALIMLRDIQARLKARKG